MPRADFLRVLDFRIIKLETGNRWRDQQGEKGREKSETIGDIIFGNFGLDVFQEPQLETRDWRADLSCRSKEEARSGGAGGRRHSAGSVSPAALCE